MSLGITVEEWLGTIRSFNIKRPDNTFTSRELMELTGLSRDKILTLLKSAISENKVSVIKITQVDISGRTAKVPAYVLKFTQKEQKPHEKKRSRNL